MIDPASLTPVLASLVLAGQTFTPQSAELERSIERTPGVVSEQTAWRFEVQPGDAWKGDQRNPAWRAELSGAKIYPYDQDVWFAFDQTLVVEGKFDAWQLIVGQFHQTRGPGPAPLVLSWNRGSMEVGAAHGDGVAPPIYEKLAVLPDWPLRTEHHIVGRFRPGLAGAGSVSLWVDGRQVVDATGLTIGYAGDPGVYFKFGAYEKPPTATQRVVVTYRNVQVSTESLIDLVAARPAPEEAPPAFDHRREHRRRWKKDRRDFDDHSARGD